jgi:CxxC motif-containing protein
LLRVLADENRIVKVDGAGCVRGVEYASQEFSDPKRMVFTVVKVRSGELPTVSVKTSRPIPKKHVFTLMRMLASIELEAPVEIGDVVLKDAYGADVVATRRVGRLKEPVCCPD